MSRKTVTLEISAKHEDLLRRYAGFPGRDERPRRHGQPEAIVPWTSAFGASLLEPGFYGRGHRDINITSGITGGGRVSLGLRDWYESGKNDACWSPVHLISPLLFLHFTLNHYRAQ